MFRVRFDEVPETAMLDVSGLILATEVIGDDGGGAGTDDVDNAAGSAANDEVEVELEVEAELEVEVELAGVEDRIVAAVLTEAEVEGGAAILRKSFATVRRFAPLWTFLIHCAAPGWLADSCRTFV
jgi:hypothetical protein